MNKSPLKDICKKTVPEGSEVVLLIKEYGYRKLKNACLERAIYIGQGPYGYEFVGHSEYKKYLKNPDNLAPYRVKQPECVLIGGTKA